MLSIIRAFATHRIAPNLLILLMVASGLLVIGRLEVRFFPKFDIQTVQINASWRGASPEAVAESVLTPLENELRQVADWDEIVSYAREGGGGVYMQFPESVDINRATEEVRRHLDLALPKLPSDIERPRVTTPKRRDDTMRLSLAGATLQELRALARRLENQLLRLGVVEVETTGLPPDRIEVHFDQRQLAELGLSLRDIGRQLSAQNVDASAGDIRGDSGGQLLRVLSKRKTMADIETIALVDAKGETFRLADVATLSRSSERDQTLVWFNGQPAVEFQVKQKQDGNALQVAERVLDWVADARRQLPAGVTLTPHNERWRAINSRVDLLVRNGAQGLLLVLLMLLIFLHVRVAFWVAVGIPATFMVAVCALHLTGGSINMISLFAFIMVTGIVVDDAIVVGENALHRRQRGEPPSMASVEGADEMFPSVFSSTFTTLSSFLPLLIVGGVIGSIMFAIPLVVTCVLLASLFECFFVLPGHLQGALAGFSVKRQNRWRKWMDDRFDAFRDRPFRRSIELALRYRWVTVSASLFLLVLSVSLMIGGALKYRFFPGAELNRIQAQVVFVAGTPRAQVERFMRRLEDSVRKTEAEFPDEEDLVQHLSTYLGRSGSQRGGNRYSRGDEKASLVAELSQPDKRRIGTRDFARAWRKNLPRQAGLEKLSIRESRGGPAGEDLEVRLSGGDIDTLKEASMELQAALTNIGGVSRPDDDMPYGKKQTVFELTPKGNRLRLTVDEIARQLRDAVNGFLVQTLYEGIDETEIRLLLRQKDGAPIDALTDIQIRLPDGGFVPLDDLVTLRDRRGFDSIQRINGSPVVNVVANIDFDVTDAETVIRQLERDILPPIRSKYGIDYSYEGSRADQSETLDDMRTGLAIAFLCIFIILAAVFSSWSLPLVILLTAPFGVIGAMWGHWLMGYDMSILSAFGVFTLNGIIVNDSIILVRDYLSRLKRHPAASRDALIVDAVCRRLRAILLTSLTTIAGLFPLMFERSTQAQFLIPMAISIAFGLGFATLLILYLLPALVSIHNSIANCLRLFAPPAARAETPAINR